MKCILKCNTMMQQTFVICKLSNKKRRKTEYNELEQKRKD